MMARTTGSGSVPTSEIDEVKDVCWGCPRGGIYGCLDPPPVMAGQRNPVFCFPGLKDSSREA